MVDEDIRRYVQLGAAFTQSTRARLERAISDLTKAGRPHEKSVQQVVDELVDWSRQNAEAALAMVRTEIGRQLEARGVATMEDVAKLASSLTGSDRGGRRSDEAGSASPRGGQPARKATGAERVATRTGGTGKGAKKRARQPTKATKTTKATKAAKAAKATKATKARNATKAGEAGRPAARAGRPAARAPGRPAARARKAPAAPARAKRPARSDTTAPRSRPGR